MITLTNQAIFLQKKLKISLEKKFVEVGGFRENLFKKRMEEKKKQRSY
jgi:four helix bundle suffix protein